MQREKSLMDLPQEQRRKLALALLTLSVQTPETAALTKPELVILRHILAYVLAHPEAKDTVEGIRQWWGLEGRTEPSEDELQKVLKFLVVRGWMTAREVTPTPRIYGVSKERLAEIEVFMRELERQAEGNDQ
jgi:hypothetical protein